MSRRNEIHQQQGYTYDYETLVNHIVVTQGLSCVANKGFPKRGKLAQHILIPNLYAVHEQALPMDLMSSLKLCVATSSERLQALHLGLRILEMKLILEGLLVEADLQLKTEKMI